MLKVTQRLFRHRHQALVHRGTLRALGLRGIGQSNVLPDRPDNSRDDRRVPHLVKVEEVNGSRRSGFILRWI